MPNDIVTKDHLTYICLDAECGLSQEVPWEITAPQQRERRLPCSHCEATTLHRLAGLGPIRRSAGCPAWCTDHRSQGDGVEQHQHLMVIWQAWHTSLGRWDSNTLEISQYGDHPLVRRHDEKVPNVSVTMSTCGVEKSRRIHALIGQAIELIAPANDNEE